MPDLSELRRQITDHFNEEELRALCFDLQIDYDSLGGRGKAAKVPEMIMLVQRNNRLPDLIAALKNHNPTIDWDSFLPSISRSSSRSRFPLHRILFHRNRAFTGREDWLAQLHEQLNSDGAVAVTQAVAGLGGIGKTQLALEYCYRYRDDYDLIWWLRADETATLGLGLAELAYALQLAGPEVTDQETLRRLVLGWLETTERRWLLLFDNADAIEPAALRPYLPKVGNGASLITSRNPNWERLAQTLRLDLFSPEEAVSFLLARSVGFSPSKPAEAGTTNEEAAQLAKTLGYLPLALEHARAYVAETGCSWADYAAYFAEERQELWGEMAAGPEDYDRRTITTTWEMAFTQVRQTPGAAALLNLCYFLAPEGIPLDLLRQAAQAEWMPEELAQTVRSKRKLDKAVAALRRYSLLERENDSLNIHRLVQTVARDRMPRELAETWAVAAIELMGGVFPSEANMYVVWPEGKRFLPHILAAIEQAATYQVTPQTIARVCNNTGYHMQTLGDYTGAKPLLERALAIFEKELGENHLNVATLNNNLGALLQTLGDYTGARPFLERALAIDEKALGPEHPDVARDLNNLAVLLQVLGDYAGARPFLERALAIFEKELGENHPNVGKLNNNLGQLLQDLGDYAGAREPMEQALAIDEKALGPDHPDVARDLNNLASLLYSMGDYAGARPFLKRALAIWEKQLGPDNPQIAAGNNNLGLLRQDLGDYTGARPLLERALAICEARLGPDHPNTKIARDNLQSLP